MSTKLVSLAAVLLGFLLSIGLAAPAQAAQVVYWKGAQASGLNKACPKGTHKMFIVQMRVPRGERIRDAGYFTLNLKNGRNKTEEMYLVPGKRKRLAEAYIAVGRRVRVDRAHPRQSYAFPVRLSRGAEARVKIMRTCIGMVP